MIIRTPLKFQRPLFCLLMFSLVPLLSGKAQGAGLPTIKIRTTRTAILNDGRDVADIIAEVRDSTGSPAANGTSVRFETNLGQFRPGMTPNVTATTQSGQARVQLIGQQKGTAKVFASVQGAVSDPTEIILTDDASETFQGNAYIDVLASGSLLYSANERIIEAKGRRPGVVSEPHELQALSPLEDIKKDPKPDADKGNKKEGGKDPKPDAKAEVKPDTGRSMPGATLTYRNIEIQADMLQVNCSENAVRASGNVYVNRGGRRLNCIKLYLPLAGAQGYAIVESGRRLARVKVKTSDLTITPTDEGIAPHFFEMSELADSPQLIMARKIRLFPGEKLQFNRPKFYTDGAALVSMPFYSLALYSNQLFTEQFMSVGSQGLSMDLPYYYDLSPVSTGIFHLRHGERSGRTGFATRPGWSLDMNQNYNSSGINRRFTGDFGFTGITGSDWGFHWNHNQEFNADTRGSFFFDVPQHRTLFASTSLSRQMGPLHAGINLSMNRSISGFSTSGSQGDVYLETNPKKVGNTGYSVAYGATASVLRNKTEGYSSNAVTEGVQARFFSKNFNLDRSTYVTNYLTLGNVWTTAGRSGASVISSFAANHTFRGGTLQMTYDFTRLPTAFTDGGSHRLSTNLIMNGGSRWNFFLYHSMVLDSNAMTTIGDFNYSLAPRWRLSLSATLQKFLGAQYRDYSFGIARNIGGRDFALSYSTLSHRIFFDLEASRF